MHEYHRKFEGHDGTLIFTELIMQQYCDVPFTTAAPLKAQKIRTVDILIYTCIYIYIRTHIYTSVYRPSVFPLSYINRHFAPSSTSPKQSQKLSEIYLIKVD
jgi:hypothetical protein